MQFVRNSNDRPKVYVLNAALSGGPPGSARSALPNACLLEHHKVFGLQMLRKRIIACFRMRLKKTSNV
jgi:hypothetical protein